MNGPRSRLARTSKVAIPAPPRSRPDQGRVAGTPGDAAAGSRLTPARSVSLGAAAIGAVRSNRTPGRRTVSAGPALATASTTAPARSERNNVPSPQPDTVRFQVAPEPVGRRMTQPSAVPLRAKSSAASDATDPPNVNA